MKMLSAPLIVIRFIIVVFLCVEGLVLSLAGPAAAGDAGRDFRRLEGKWVRPDGGYVIELRGIRKDGSVSAAYFNPSPIKVYSARLTKKNGMINLFLELRDVNYPGSKYNLIYDSATDRLRGTYFQAAEKKTFNVEFIRVNK